MAATYLSFRSWVCWSYYSGLIRLHNSTRLKWSIAQTEESYERIGKNDANAEKYSSKTQPSAVSLRSLLEYRWLLNCQTYDLEVWFSPKIPIVKSQAVQIQEDFQAVVLKIELP